MVHLWVSAFNAMTLTESIVEEATLECLSELGHFCQRSKALIPAFSHREKEIGHDPDMAPGKFLIPD